MQTRQPSQPLTADQIEIRVWGFVVIMVTCILMFIVVALLYSVTFVTQPIKSMAPIDQAYTKMLNDIVLLIVGGIGGIMSKRAVKAAANTISPHQPPMLYSAQPMGQPQSPQYTQPTTQMPNWNWMGYQNPDLDESWTPGPPPTTPADYLHPERDQIANERMAARSENVWPV